MIHHTIHKAPPGRAAAGDTLHGSFAGGWGRAPPPNHCIKNVPGKEKENTTPFTAGNRTDEHLRNKNCHTPERYIRERERSERWARGRAASRRHRVPGGEDGAP